LETVRVPAAAPAAFSGAPLSAAAAVATPPADDDISGAWLLATVGVVGVGLIGIAARRRGERAMEAEARHEESASEASRYALIE
jgi:hypothetical protein